MAWQNSTAMGSNGGGSGAGGEGNSNGGQPQGTEYTLQGIDEIDPSHIGSNATIWL